MRKLYIFGLIGLAVLIIGLAFADQMTFTTYYPAPYGVYNDMRVMNRLGVGTTEPARALHVAGIDGMRLEPSDRPDPADVGDIVIDNDDKILKWYDGSDWQPLGAPAYKIVYGTIAGTGAKTSGEGFMSQRIAPGKFVVTFTSAFSTVPAVTITPIKIDPHSNPNPIIKPGSITTTGFQFYVGNTVSGGAQDDPTSIIAVGK